MTALPLAGKAGIVTGGSSGIGFQMANVLAESGAQVYVISRTGAPKPDAGVSSPGVIHLKGDISEKEAMEKMVADMEMAVQIIKRKTFIKKEWKGSNRCDFLSGK